VTPIVAFARAVDPSPRSFAGANKDLHDEPYSSLGRERP